MSSFLNSTLTLYHSVEDALETIQTALGLSVLELISDPNIPDDYHCVRYEESSGGPDAGQQYTFVKLSIKSNEEWIGKQILALLLTALGLSSLQPVFESYLPEADWAPAAPGASSAPLTGDHLRITPHSATLWQTVADDPEIYHVAISLRIYHD